MRELSTSKVGTLLRISGQVVRTHPVHPELTCGTFMCLECQTVISDVEQQFKFTQPTVSLSFTVLVDLLSCTKMLSALGEMYSTPARLLITGV